MRTYGHELRDRAVEVVNLRLQAIGVVEKPTLPFEKAEGIFRPTPASVHRDPTGVPAEHFAREDLRPGARFQGPALIFQMDCTSFVATGWEARVDGYKNIIMERQS